MSLFESQDGSATVSLSDMFANKAKVASSCDLDLLDYAYLVCRGGWPRAIGLDKEEALEQAYVFYDGLVFEDINRVFRRARNPERIKRFMRSYARAISTETSLAEIRKDMASNDQATLDEATVSAYVNALERLFVIENLPAAAKVFTDTEVRISILVQRCGRALCLCSAALPMKGIAMSYNKLNPLEKETLIKLFRRSPGVGLGEFCRANGVSDAAFRSWMKRYDEEGLEGLYRSKKTPELLPPGADRSAEGYKRELIAVGIELKVMITSQQWLFEISKTSQILLVKK